MLKNTLRIVVAAGLIAVSSGAAQSQSQTIPPSQTTKPSTQALDAARELVITTKFADKFKALMPTIMKTLRPSMVQGRPEIEKDYDALVPQLLASMQERVGELQEAVTIIYATSLTIDEMKAVTAFFQSRAGKTYLAKSVSITERSMAAGQQFGQMVGAEAQKKMVDELRKKGHAI